MEIKKIEMGKIPFKISGGTNNPIEKIAPINPINNEKQPMPDWEITKEPNKDNKIDIKI